jgi:gliding motility-associated-like protein
MKLSLFAPSIALILLISATTLIAQSNNTRPRIIGQTPAPLETMVNQPITIELTNLIVNDPDPQPVYPDGFTLDISTGRNYRVDQNTVTPDRNFTGRLRVPVRVDDGRQSSRSFDVEIDVKEIPNAAPTITGQVELTIGPGESLVILLSHLIVADPDNVYPDDFHLDVFNGNNYRREGNTITARSNFIGDLTVPVRVVDGTNESPIYDLKVTVRDAENIAPIITGQKEIKTQEEAPIEVKLGDLSVVDPDNNFPKDFSLAINPGANYSVSGTTVTPAKDFSGNLSVPVQVSDGQDLSAPFVLKIGVNPVNDAPVIIGQDPLSTLRNTPVVVTMDHLRVDDPDSNYPSEFSMKLGPGNNYTSTGNTVQPGNDFTGEISVKVSVNDGAAESNIYLLKITVEPGAKNTAPVITGQKPLSIVEGTSRLILFSDLVVTDPDNTYPGDFSLSILPGDNYSVKGQTVTPLHTFKTGTLSVTVIVNDGNDSSPPFALKIQVVPASTRPIIIGQQEVSMQEDSSLEILLSMLKVSDADNPTFPKGFSLQVQPDTKKIYTAKGNTITPTADLNGFIEIGVKVSDGVNWSDIYNLSVLVEPVNDAPEILSFDDSPLSYEPGENPIALYESVEITDVDSDHLTLAEIGFDSLNHQVANDGLLVADSRSLKIIHDPSGVVFLVGFAPLQEYEAAIRSIMYHFQVTLDERGNPTEILSGPRNIYITLHDGQSFSSRYERQITMETKIELDIPNTFTPNGDQANDTWKIRSSNLRQLDKAVIRVYNKTGLLLYEAIGFENEWDGVANGQRLPGDTYFYTIDVNLNFMKQTYKGIVTILN